MTVVRTLNRGRQTRLEYLHSPVTILWAWQAPRTVDTSTRTLYEFGKNLYRLRFSINLFTYVYIYTFLVYALSKHILRVRIIYTRVHISEVYGISRYNECSKI